MAMTLVIILAILIILFGLAFVTRRRFGVLGLALAAGVVLAQNATKYVSDFFEQNNILVTPLSYDSAATVCIILLPAIILLIGGPVYHSKKAALVGAFGFALLGTLFLLGPLTTALPAEDRSMRSALVTLSQWQNAIVVVALLLALIDTFMVHGAVARHHKSIKH